MAVCPRALVLHGFRMNGGMMQDMMADVCTALRTSVERWRFVDATIAATGPALPFVQRRWPSQACYEWWNAERDGDGQAQYLGADATLAQLDELVSSEPFDLLVGYSQGAAMATALTALVERRQIVPAERWYGVVLLNSGPVPRDASLARWLRRPLMTPSLHVGGGVRDMTFEEQEAMTHVWSATTRSVVTHGEGHAPPTAKQSPETLNAMAEWVRSL